MARLLPFVLWAVAAAAQSNDSVFDFPEFPPAGTPDPNATLANSVAPHPYNVYEDPGLANAEIHYDTGSYGPTVELFHAYYNYWPIGVGVASTGQVFTSFPRGNETYTLATLTSTTTEAAWPDQEWNTPPAFANASNPGYSIATDKLLFVQAVIVDGLDRVWALDTGRPEVNGSYLLAAVPGGPKIIGFYLNGTNFATYTFPANVVYADSSINDVRFDLRGGGYAYLTDSSPNRPGLIVLDMATGQSWRHLDNHQSVTPDNGFVPVYDGVPFYLYPVTTPYAVNNFGVYAADGIALSSDGEYLYFAPLASRQFWRIPTSYLKVAPGPDAPHAYMLAKQAVEHLGESGSNADGMETDSSGYIYVGAPVAGHPRRRDPTERRELRLLHLQPALARAQLPERDRPAHAALRDVQGPHRRAEGDAIGLSKANLNPQSAVVLSSVPIAGRTRFESSRGSCERRRLLDLTSIYEHIALPMFSTAGRDHSAHTIPLRLSAAHKTSAEPSPHSGGRAHAFTPSEGTHMHSSQ